MRKLGKYFTKGLLTGVLATALMAGTAGCSNAAGGNTYTPDDGNIGGGNGGQTGWVKPDYMNITAEFGGQRFAEGVEGNDSFHNNPNKDANFENYYKDAQDFMTYEVNNLQKLFNRSKFEFCKRWEIRQKALQGILNKMK